VAHVLRDHRLQKYSLYKHVKKEERKNRPSPVKQQYDIFNLVLDFGNDTANNVATQFAWRRLKSKRMFELDGNVKHVFHVPNVTL